MRLGVRNVVLVCGIVAFMGLFYFYSTNFSLSPDSQGGENYLEGEDYTESLYDGLPGVVLYLQEQLNEEFGIGKSSNQGGETCSEPEVKCKYFEFPDSISLDGNPFEQNPKWWKDLIGSPGVRNVIGQIATVAVLWWEGQTCEDGCEKDGPQIGAINLRVVPKQTVGECSGEYETDFKERITSCPPSKDLSCVLSMANAVQRTKRIVNDLRNNCEDGCDSEVELLESYEVDGPIKKFIPFPPFYCWSCSINLEGKAKVTCTGDNPSGEYELYVGAVACGNCGEPSEDSLNVDELEK